MYRIITHSQLAVLCTHTSQPLCKDCPLSAALRCSQRSCNTFTSAKISTHRFVYLCNYQYFCCVTDTKLTYFWANNTQNRNAFSTCKTHEMLFKIQFGFLLTGLVSLFGDNKMVWSESQCVDIHFNSHFGVCFSSSVHFFP